jgi:hypothetical protein
VFFEFREYDSNLIVSEYDEIYQNHHYSYKLSERNNLKPIYEMIDENKNLKVVINVKFKEIIMTNSFSDKLDKYIIERFDENPKIRIIVPKSVFQNLTEEEQGNKQIYLFNEYYNITDIIDLSHLKQEKLEVIIDTNIIEKTNSIMFDSISFIGKGEDMSPYYSNMLINKYKESGIEIEINDTYLPSERYGRNIKLSYSASYTDNIKRILMVSTLISILTYILLFVKFIQYEVGVLIMLGSNKKNIRKKYSLEVIIVIFASYLTVFIITSLFGFIILNTNLFSVIFNKTFNLMLILAYISLIFFYLIILNISIRFDNIFQYPMKYIKGGIR